MKPSFIVALAASCAALSSPVVAQQGQMVSREAAEALYTQVNAVCAAGPINRKACGVLVYSPEDCA